MWKLVRDKIQDLSIENDDGREFAKVKGFHYTKCLRLKLLEEAEEVLEAPTRENLVEELADVFAVLEQLMIEEGVFMEEVTKERVVKEDNKGGFTKGIIMKLGS